LRFSRKQQDGYVPIVFHLFITTCIEKHCTGL